MRSDQSGSSGLIRQRAILTYKYQVLVRLLMMSWFNPMSWPACETRPRQVAAGNLKAQTSAADPQLLVGLSQEGLLFI